MTSENLEQLKLVLSRLASSSGKQEAYLLELGVLPSVDELALELDDSLASSKLHDPRASSLLIELDKQLSEMSGEENARLWVVDALKMAPEWGVVRELAGRILLAIEAME